MKGTGSDVAGTAVEAVQPREPQEPVKPISQAELGELTVENGAGMKIFGRTLKVVTESRVELYNLTDRVRELVKASGIKAGFVIISSLHTTTALFINEFQAALMADLKSFLNRLANKEHGYLHNCEDCSDCDRANADSHIKAMVLGHNLTLPVHEGAPLLGQWQSILFAELDGPRERQLTAQVIGI